MSDNNKKTSIEQAKADFDGIVNFAKEQIQSELDSKVEDMISEAIKEMDNAAVETEEGTIEEAVKVETDDVTVEVDDDGGVVVSKSGEMDVDNDMEDLGGEDVVDDELDVPADEVGDEEEFEISEDAEIFEVASDINEETVEEMDQYLEQEGDIEETPEDLIRRGIEGIIDAKDVEGGDDGVDIVDDAPEAAPAPEAIPAAPAPTPEIPAAPVAEEQIFEIELEEGDDAIEIELDEECDICDGDCEGHEELDEMKMQGASNSVQRTVGKSAGPEVAVKNRGRRPSVAESQEKNSAPVAEIAQDEVEVAELKEENEGLKEKIKEFNQAFIELRKQFNEMQTFNGKLSYAYRVLSEGGLTDKEKVKITEKFDAAKTVEEAEKIYKDILKEKKTSPATSEAMIKSSIKSSDIKTAPYKKEPIYESAEARRMRELAGLEDKDPNSLLG